MADSGRASAGGDTCNFLLCKPPRSFRKRKSSSFDEDDASPSIPKRKNPAASQVHFSSARPSTPDASAYNLHPTPFHYPSSTVIQVDHDSRATATLETETDFSKDNRSIRERILKLTELALKSHPELGAASSCSKVYKGINSYTDYKAGFRREQTVAGEKASGAHGPLRASPHIRMSTRFDYQPDICKDYKETGYCGFGDACKYLHDRAESKLVWLLEKEWEEIEKEKAQKLAMKGEMKEEKEKARKLAMKGEDEEGGRDDNALPFACFICKQPFRAPVVTKCSHYFCEHCALKHHDKNKKCFVCNKPTLGLFNAAHEIKKRAKLSCSS